MHNATQRLFPVCLYVAVCDATLMWSGTLRFRLDALEEILWWILGRPCDANVIAQARTEGDDRAATRAAAEMNRE